MSGPVDVLRLSRRRFLAGAAAAGALGWTTGLWTPARARALRRTLATIADPTGTTLEATVIRLEPSAAGYRRLGDGPGWPIVVREDLATAQAGREDRRRPLASLVHLTDIHVIDAQSPGRVEFLDRYADPPSQSLPFSSAFRPQETLTVQVASSMVRRVNTIGRGPVTGRAFDCAVSTGDNIDNQQLNEMQWFLSVLDGGRVVPDSGARGVYEGIQDAVAPDPHYWHPDPGVADLDKLERGFPDYPGLLAAAITGFDAPGLEVPWYSVYGNHDGLLQGNVNAVLEPGGIRPLDPILTGPVKITALPLGVSLNDVADALVDPTSLRALFDVLATLSLPRVVTADPDRRSVSPQEWAAGHFAGPATPGPVGHGYQPEAVESGRLYYTFPVAPGVLGISLDTVNQGGYESGTMTSSQLAWLEARLAEVHSRYFDAAGTPVRTAATDQLVILFSHHNLYTLDNGVPDPARLDDPRNGFPVLRELLNRFPNVVAWVNGHSHVNRVTPVPDPSGRTGGFWEISTAAHVDYPEHGRLVEVVDNGDGTLSIFGTIIEHAAPAGTDPDDLSPLGLASISRELSANDGQFEPARLGTTTDLNVELVLRAPFVLSPAPGPAAETARGTLAATGGSALAGPLVAGTAALAGALALRRRLETSPPA